MVALDEWHGATAIETGPLSPDLRFFACVRSSEGRKRILDEWRDMPRSVTIVVADNLRAAQESHVVILGCKPRAAEDLLRTPGLAQALGGKLVISILGGTSTQRLEELLYSDTRLEHHNRCTFVSAIPNIAAECGDSITIVAEGASPQASETTRAIFSLVGCVKIVPKCATSQLTALCASAPAFLALIMESMVKDSVRRGIATEEAVEMAALVMKGTATLVLAGMTPKNIIDRVAVPGGSTEKGLQMMKDLNVPESIYEAVRVTSDATSGLMTKSKD